MSGVLLVTNDKELARIVKLALADTPARLLAECNNAKQAADVYAKASNALVILDMFLPESSGVDLLKNLKRLNETGTFMMLNRIRTRTMVERSFRMGAQDVLQYPVNVDVLRETILHRLKNQPTGEAGDTGETAAPKPARKK